MTRTNECRQACEIVKSIIVSVHNQTVRYKSGVLIVSASIIQSVSAQTDSRKFIQNYAIMIQPKTFSTADEVAGKMDVWIEHVSLDLCWSGLRIGK